VDLANIQKRVDQDCILELDHIGNQLYLLPRSYNLDEQKRTGSGTKETYFVLEKYLTIVSDVIEE